MTLHEVAQTMEYPGRFLILGNTETHFINIYGVTARSEASRAKRYIHLQDEGKIVVIPTDADVMAQGDLTLLDYAAAHMLPAGVVIGNGRQTDTVVLQESARDSLVHSLEAAEFEHDKYHTPRITGCAMQSGDTWSQALHIIRDNGNGESERSCFEMSTSEPRTVFISTYAGPNVRPTPSFMRDPILLDLHESPTAHMARYVYEAFEPGADKEDLRVAAVCVLIDKLTGAPSVEIVNAVDVRS